MILVYGDTMVDVTHHMKTERNAPEDPTLPVWVPDGQPITRQPGGAANVVANIRGLGQDCSLISPYGSDGIISGFFFGSAIISKNRWYNGDKLVFRFDYDNAPKTLHVTNAVGSVLDSLKKDKVEALVLSDYGKGALGHWATRTIINAAMVKGVPIIADPKGYDLSKYEGVDWLTPNALEAETLGLGKSTLYMGSGIKHIIMKNGPGPVLFMSKAGSSMIDVPPCDVVDPTGAGDSFIAGFTVALVNGQPAVQAIKFGIKCAQEACEHVGTYACSQ